MGGYIINFTVYTLAMSGLIFFAFYVYKKVMNGSVLPAKNHDMYIEETLHINPRKSLMVVNTGGERFLIASDVDKTTLISKLSNHTAAAEKKEASTTTQDIKLEEVNKFIEKVQQDAKSSEVKEESLEQSAIEIGETSDIDNPDEALDKLYGPVHLEVISNKNPNPIRRKHSYMSKNYAKGKTVTIDVGAAKGGSASPIKGIVQKVNNI
ncbi:FliO/MopB family protein [bacterium]|nr:FliO/MopB family protein [bacterium]